MKKYATCILLICMVGVLGGCSGWKDSHLDGKEALGQIREWSETLGEKQLTQDTDLIGTRTLEQEDDFYNGDYAAIVEETTGRDVVFGGAGIEERTIVCSGKVTVISGDIKIRVRMNEDVVYITPDENGHFEKEFSFTSGGNYLMVDYEDFTGSIDLRCKEGEDGHDE